MKPVPSSESDLARTAHAAMLSEHRAGAGEQNAALLDVEEAVPIPSPHDEVGASSRLGRRSWRLKAAATIAVALFASVAFVTVLRGNSSRKFSPGVALEMKAEVLGKCSRTEDGINYAFTMSVPAKNVQNAEACCIECQTFPSCKAWMWVKDSGLQYSDSKTRCWLKSGKLKGKVDEAGVVSGYLEDIDKSTAEAGPAVAPFPLLPKAQDLWCKDDGDFPELWKYRGGPGEPVQVKVLSYNLMWWHLFSDWKMGRSWLIKTTGNPKLYDVMGFQECEDPKWVLDNAGLEGQYAVFHGLHGTCMAYRKASWEHVSNGQADVSEDTHKQYFSKRAAQWMRLRHRETSKTMFFMNHHGPTPIDSGGLCGGAATAHRLVKIIAAEAQHGDAVILVGDFNARAHTQTIETLSQRLREVDFTGERAFGGIDHIFTNVPTASHVNAEVLSKGGSDHNAISAVLELSSGHADFPRSVNNVLNLKY